MGWKRGMGGFGEGGGEGGRGKKKNQFYKYISKHNKFITNP